ncbi:unnamed protein product [Moneuplotes crassus]|uniref:USP domain-containing protein n=1 Tax=Euplotes crassus TaxID=5936 RepID=A0AAD1Y9L2_EUPCR|nr:unnamed protein product [Moneuplotes crassus]
MSKSNTNPKNLGIESSKEFSIDDDSRDPFAEPETAENIFSKTYRNTGSFAFNGKGRFSRVGRDPSEEQKNIKERNSYRSGSPDRFEDRYPSLELQKNIGLRNPKNDCFMNASLQVMFSIPELMKFFATKEYKNVYSFEECNKKKAYSSKEMILPGYKYCNAMSKLCLDVCSSFKKELEATELRKLFKKSFSKSHQHDANDFILSLFSKLQDEQTLKKRPVSDKFANEQEAWEHYVKHNPSIIDQLFFGMIQRSSRCGSCKKVAHRYESFNQIELECESSSLEMAYQGFLSDEIMKKNQSYRCDECHKVVKCRIMKEIVKMPRYLFFLFKRFNSNMSKITKMIKYRTKILLEDKIDGGPLEYHLQGIILHSESRRGGHYISYAKKGDNWIRFNDASYKPIKSKHIIDKDAYILLYKRA